MNPEGRLGSNQDLRHRQWLPISITAAAILLCVFLWRMLTSSALDQVGIGPLQNSPAGKAATAVVREAASVPESERSAPAADRELRLQFVDANNVPVARVAIVEADQHARFGRGAAIAHSDGGGNVTIQKARIAMARDCLAVHSDFVTNRLDLWGRKSDSVDAPASGEPLVVVLQQALPQRIRVVDRAGHMVPDLVILASVDAIGRLRDVAQEHGAWWPGADSKTAVFRAQCTPYGEGVLYSMPQESYKLAVASEFWALDLPRVWISP